MAKAVTLEEGVFLPIDHWGNTTNSGEKVLRKYRHQVAIKEFEPWMNRRVSKTAPAYRDKKGGKQGTLKETMTVGKCEKRDLAKPNRKARTSFWVTG